MNHFRFFTALMLVGLLHAVPVALSAAEPEPLPMRTFDVRIEGGAAEVTFALALSEVSSYPVTVTAISGTVEELLWEGMLQEGFYRLRAPLTKITSGTLKIVLRTKVTNRTTQGPQSFIRYLTWEGAFNR